MPCAASATSPPALSRPTVKLGVTGLARSGKTVFITALVHNLIAGARLPFFDAAAQGRLLRVYLEPQPDDAVPRFEYEKHLADLTGDPPRWPESTRRISQLRLTLEYASTKFWKRQLGRERLHIDIVDYPGEWLLDLPLLETRLSGMVADRARAEPDGGAQENCQAMACIAQPGRSDRSRRRGSGEHTLRSSSRLICARRAPTRMRSRRCRRAAFSCRAISPARRRSPSPRSIPAGMTVSRGLALGDDGAALRGL